MTSSPFDTIAGSYDSDFERNEITQAIRPIVLQSALTFFKPGHHILELNCGTGTDAVTLAQNGIFVTATDESSEMLNVLKAKLRTHTLQTLIRPIVTGFEQLDTIEEQYDGIFSNFGGLNCASDISNVINDLSRLLKPEGIFIGCLLNKFCLWESISFLGRGQPARAIRRFKSTQVTVQLGSSTMQVRYYTPKQFAGYLLPSFQIMDIYGLSIFSPSPNSRRFAGRHPKLITRLLAIDDILRNKFPFTSLGDHFVIIAKKKQ